MIRSRINLLYMSKEKRRPLVYPSSSQSEGRRTSGSAHGGVTLKKRWKTRSSFCNSVSRTLYVVNRTITKRNFLMGKPSMHHKVKKFALRFERIFSMIPFLYRGTLISILTY